MSIIRSGDTTASSLEELNRILHNQYDNSNTGVKLFSRRLTSSGGAGITYLTPDGLLTAVNGFFTKKFEDVNANSDYANSFRLYSDIIVIIAPQIHGVNARLTLSLYDSATSNEFNSDDAVTLSTDDGACVVVFDINHSIPNRDRININGKKVHRRLGIKYFVELPDSDNDPASDVTYFTMSANWNRQVSLTPSYYKHSNAFVIPITSGYKSHKVFTNPKFLEMSIRAGVNVANHTSAPGRLVGNLKLASKQQETLDVSKVLNNQNCRKKTIAHSGNQSAKPNLYKFPIQFGSTPLSKHEPAAEIQETFDCGSVAVDHT